MNSFYDVLLFHSSAYPDMQPQDYLKLAFQSEYGCGHLLADKKAAYEYLCSELDTVRHDALEPMITEISGGYTRLNLAAVKGLISPEIIFKMFELSCTDGGSDEGFKRKLSLILRSAKMGIIKADPVALENYFSEYDGKIPSHSQIFKRKYRASYRVIKSEFATIVPLCALISDACSKAERVSVAIDGRAGTGKTSIATTLASLYDCDVISMDDYFLPMERKTTERLSEPGGNIDYERFKKEIVDHINDDVILTSRFDCRKNALLPPKSIVRKQLVIVEGVYSHHPYFNDPYTIKVFVDTDPLTQRDRLLERDGKQMLERYLNEWIPLEEHYFRTYQPVLSADIKINT